MRLYWEGGGCEIWQGDALAWLAGLEADLADAIVTDPPYSSGGFTRGDRSADVATKYTSSGTVVSRPGFSGDSRDARSWVRWVSMWGAEALRVVRPSGYFLCFTDWRQLPCASDALQAAGWVWRGVNVWNKGEGARPPNRAYFRHQSEFIVWGTRGVSLGERGGGPWAGVCDAPVVQADKHHLTGKPVRVMDWLLGVVPAGGLVLDPFLGSGTTLVAALRRGVRCLGCEVSEEYCEVSADRARRELEQGRLRFDGAGATPPAPPCKGGEIVFG